MLEIMNDGFDHIYEGPYFEEKSRDEAEEYARAMMGRIAYHMKKRMEEEKKIADGEKGKKMKFFVSGKIGVEDDAKEVMEALRIAGHEITFDWTAVEHLKPYDKKPRACRMAAVVDVNGVKEADVFVIIPHERGIGMYIELGIAIASGIPIRVVTGAESRSMFYYHPLVKKVSGVQEIIEEFSIGNTNETETR